MHAEYSIRYEYVMALKLYLTIDSKTTAQTLARRDQFGPELLYFSDCIRKNIAPEPSGEEGLADVRIVRALYRASETGKPVKLKSTPIRKRPTLKQEKHRPPVAKPQLVHAESASA
jgi:Oxidoreductase family, C-terminal alpha/beta domain